MPLVVMETPYPLPAPAVLGQRMNVTQGAADDPEAVHILVGILVGVGRPAESCLPSGLPSVELIFQVDE